VNIIETFGQSLSRVVGFLDSWTAISRYTYNQQIVKITPPIVSQGSFQRSCHFVHSWDVRKKKVGC
jgi:allantoicase